jgi:predicted porin
MSGSSELAATGTAGVPGSAIVRTEATSADLQAHGVVAGKDMGVYVTYARAPAAQAGSLPQLFNAGAKDKSAFAVGLDYSVIPHTLHVGGAYRLGKTGVVSTADPSVSTTDNALMLQAIYDMTQNVALHVTAASRNGTKYSEAPTTATGAKEYLLMLEAAW